MGRYKNTPKSGNNSLLMQLLGYALTRFIIPFVILLMKLLAYIIFTFILPFILPFIISIRKKLSDQQRLLCSKCHGKLEVIDKDKFYCKNCKIIKMDRRYY